MNAITQELISNLQAQMPTPRRKTVEALVDHCKASVEIKSCWSIDHLRDIYAAAWEIGSCNPRGMLHSLPAFVEEFGAGHAAVKIFVGHLAFLLGVGLGPESEDAKCVHNLILSHAA